MSRPTRKEVEDALKVLRTSTEYGMVWSVGYGVSQINDYTLRDLRVLSPATASRINALNEEAKAIRSQANEIDETILKTAIEDDSTWAKAKRSVLGEEQ